MAIEVKVGTGAGGGSGVFVRFDADLELHSQGVDAVVVRGARKAKKLIDEVIHAVFEGVVVAFGGAKPEGAVLDPGLESTDAKFFGDAGVDREFLEVGIDRAAHGFLVKEVFEGLGVLFAFDAHFDRAPAGIGVEDEGDDFVGAEAFSDDFEHEDATVSGPAAGDEGSEVAALGLADGGVDGGEDVEIGASDRVAGPAWGNLPTRAREVDVVVEIISAKGSFVRGSRVH